MRHQTFGSVKELYLPGQDTTCESGENGRAEVVLPVERAMRTPRPINHGLWSEGK